MNYIAENWFLMVAAAAIVGMCIYVVVDITRMPRDEQVAQVREWMLYAVIEAESVLGGGTGQLKLRFVYDMFVERFPWMARMIDFEWFSELVDEALERMRKMLNTNKAIKAVVDGEAL